jgi:Fe-S cluster assembly protein SufD
VQRLGVVMAARRTESLSFAPTSRVLEFAIEELAELGAAGGGAVPAAERRAALEIYARFGPERRAYPPGWRHDYAALGYDDLHWSSGRARVPALPVHRPAVPARPDERSDAPALAVENAGGLVHLASTYLQPQTSRADPRLTLLALADAQRTLGARVAATHRRLVDVRTDRFVALSTAFQNCGAYVEVPSDVALDAPVQLVWTTRSGVAGAIFPHTVVRIGARARATIVERHVGEGESFVAGTVEIDLAPGAQLDYVVIQNGDDGARMLGSRVARCAAGARIGWHVAHLGGALVRDAIDARLDGAGARADIDALFFARGFANVDLAIACAHRAPRTASHAVVRDAALDRGRGRYFGSITVDADAAGTHATMRDDALILSRNAYLEAVPNLEIDCSEVAVAQSASVGTLDRDALFYVQTRGIARGRAERMMALAFFEAAVARFPTDSIRDEERTLLDARLDEIPETFAQ